MITSNNIYQVAVKVNSGSGVLIKIGDGYFIVTAVHCIKESGDNLLKSFDNKYTYSELDKFFHKDRTQELQKNESDIVLIQIELKNESIFVETCSEDVNVNDAVESYGFPNKADDDGMPLSGNILKWNNVSSSIKTDLSYKGPTKDDVDAKLYIEGWSGSGVFKKKDKDLYLIGILKSLTTEDHSYQDIKLIPISLILEVIEYNSLGVLPSQDLNQLSIEKLTFSDFNSVLNEFEPNIQKLLSPLSSTISSSFMPSNIFKVHDEKMFIPEKHPKEVSNKSLWEGWLLFLIYLYLLKPNISLGDYIVNIDGKEIKVDFLFNEENKRFGDLIYDLFNSAIFRSKKSDIFIFNNIQGNLKPNVLSVERQKRIISDFTVVNSWYEEVIGEYQFGCLHIAELTDEVADNTEDDLAELKKNIKDKIIEVLKNVL